MGMGITIWPAIPLWRGAPPTPRGGSPYQRLINLYFPHPTGPPQNLRTGVTPPGGRTPVLGHPKTVLFDIMFFSLSCLNFSFLKFSLDGNGDHNLASYTAVAGPTP